MAIDKGISRRRLGLATLAGMAMPMVARAEAPWPNRPLRLIVPWPPGGPTDKYSRLVGDALSRSLGQSVVVENRAGASGILGIEHASKAKPDGYTILSANNTAFVGSAVATPDIVRYDPVKDFETLAIYQEGASIIFAHPSIGARNFDEFVKVAKASDKPIPFASPGPGSMSALSADILARKIGFNVLPVVYRGTGPGITAVISGEVKFTLIDVALARDHVKAGNLIPLISTGTEPVAEFPGIPSFGSLGLTELDFYGWHALFVPTGVPAAITAKLRDALREATRADAFVQVATDSGARAIFQTGDEAAARIARAFDERRRLAAAGAG